MDTDNQDQGETKWNSHQEKQKGNVNEGFSGENLSPDYDPGSQDARPLERETEVDEHGNRRNVERARHPDDTEAQTHGGAASAGNEAIEHPKSVQNRDFNYDRDAQRYPPDHPENHEDRDTNP